MKIAICEDDIKNQSLLESYLEEYPADLEWKIFSSGEELLAHIKEDKDYFSLYFMDISLPGIDGIQTCAQIRKRDQKALIVFVTDYKEYVYEVFQVLPFRFLIKPVKKEAFSKVLREAADFLRLHDRRLTFRIRQTMYEIPWGEILYLEGDLRKVHLHTVLGEYTFYGKLEKLKEQLTPGGFFQCHKSYVVNPEYIRASRETSIILRNGEEIPVSKSFRKKSKEKHLQYLKGRWGQ